MGVFNCYVVRPTESGVCVDSNGIGNPHITLSSYFCKRRGVDMFPEVDQEMSYSDKFLGRIFFWTTGSRKVVTKQHKPTYPVAC